MLVLILPHPGDIPSGPPSPAVGGCGNVTTQTADTDQGATW